LIWPIQSCKKIGTHLIPKEFVMTEQSLGDLSDGQISAMLEYLDSQIGKNAKIINAEPIGDMDLVSASPDEE
jgi:hypothetical protein